MPYKHPLHETILQQGWAAVTAVVIMGQQETVDLDFKNKADPSQGSLDKKDKETLGQLLSAFANSIGGLAVIGIDCRTTSTGSDEATSINSIRDIKRFASEVRTNIPNLVMPRLDDVTVDFIDDPSLPGAGILLVSVGRSERRPHRSEAAGDKRYYKRSGSNTIQMEHFDVEDSFRRLTNAKLSVPTPRCVKGGGIGDVEEFFLEFSLHNISNITAKFPYLEVEELRGGIIDEYGIDGGGTFPLLPTLRAIRKAFAGDASTVVHPGQVLPVFRLVFHVHRISRRLNCSTRFPKYPERFISVREASVQLSLSISCENSPLSRQTFTFTSNDLEDLFRM